MNNIFIFKYNKYFINFTLTFKMVFKTRDHILAELEKANPGFELAFGESN